MVLLATSREETLIKVIRRCGIALSKSAIGRNAYWRSAIVLRERDQED
jgi:hypothetical protein